MGPTWILVVILADGGVEIDELENEAAAFAAYERALERDYVDLYLAPVRCAAHRTEAGPSTYHAVDFATRPGTWNAIRQILEERRRQDQQWGGENHDDEHDACEWLAMIDEHRARARKVVHDRDAYRARLVVIAALALAAIESFDRGGRSAS